MSAFLVAHVTFKEDRSLAEWADEYVARVGWIVRKHGGRFVAVSPHQAGGVETVEGSSVPPSGMVIHVYPSMDDLKAFLDDPEYAPLKQARVNGTVSEFWAFESNDEAPQFLGDPPQLLDR
ncbi:DUF1330 domain-containing protein [Mycobacteroides abscessus]|nr:DUF1330 domain-containing protein [Mycobacteroides abscessus]MDM2427132.1 DUF1330 domain-containing protein [Mycobacteroides abscessus]MDM2432201.1 DUF1330 domain-containing protein [Mycobacteroides abscessus]MDM2436718.1 DUF1330 domain-containing protein [Mycobacteroides abscessus]MDM2438672.1 DUF1330 domain-containing protein [Mycobacteroides abscessus]